MRAKDVQDPQDETLADAKTAKSVNFTESVNLSDAPKPLQDMAHNAGNKLSSKKQADLAFENGAWKFHGDRRPEIRERSVAAGVFLVRWVRWDREGRPAV